jgi:hypothetical protein
MLSVLSGLYAYVPEPKDRASVEATTRTGLIAGLAGLAALGSLALTTRTYRLTEQRQLTDRYTKAIAQLGDDKLDIRLGGIYALDPEPHTEPSLRDRLRRPRTPRGPHSGWPLSGRAGGVDSADVLIRGLRALT